jgi:hypothetical protein
MHVRLGVTSSRDLQLLFDGMQPQGSTPFIQPLAAKVLGPFYACCRRRSSAEQRLRSWP